MTYTAPMTIHLTPDQEAIVEQVLAAGLARSAEQFVSAALEQQRSRLQEHVAFDRWVREHVIPAHDEFMKDPSKGKTADEVRRELLGDRA